MGSGPEISGHVLTLHSNALDLCFWRLFRHSLMFQSRLSQTHPDLLDKTGLPHFLGKRIRRIHPQLLITCQCLLSRIPLMFSCHMRGRARSKSSGGHLWQGLLSGCSKESMSQVLTEGLQNEPVWSCLHS